MLRQPDFGKSRKLSDCFEKVWELINASLTGLRGISHQQLHVCVQVNALLKLFIVAQPCNRASVGAKSY